MTIFTTFLLIYYTKRFLFRYNQFFITSELVLTELESIVFMHDSYPQLKPVLLSFFFSNQISISLSEYMAAVNIKFLT